MDLTLYKDKRNTGKIHHKVPPNTNCTKIKHIVLKEITKYINEYNDLGECNYLHHENVVLYKLNPYTTYVYEDLY